MSCTPLSVCDLRLLSPTGSMKDKDKRHSKKKSGDASAQDVKDAAGGQEAGVVRVNGDSHTETTDHFTWTDEDEDGEGRNRRRMLHAQTEGKRKERMRAGIETLRKLLPLEHRSHGQRESLVCVLERAEQYILQLRDQRDRCIKQDGDTVREEEIARLRLQLDEATTLNQRYRSVLQHANIPEFLAADLELIKQWKSRPSASDNSVNHNQTIAMASLSSPGSQSEAGDSSNKSKKKKKNRHTVSAALQKVEGAAQKVDNYLPPHMEPPVAGSSGTLSGTLSAIFGNPTSESMMSPTPPASMSLAVPSADVAYLPSSSEPSLVISEANINSGTSALVEGNLEPDPVDAVTAGQSIDSSHTAALDTLATVAESANNLTPDGTANGPVPNTGSVHCSDTNMQTNPAMTTSAPGLASLAGMNGLTGSGGVVSGPGLIGAPNPMINMSLLGGSNHGNALGGQLVYQNGQLILINDPGVASPAALPPIQTADLTADTNSLIPVSTAQGNNTALISTNMANNCTVTGNRPNVDLTKTLPVGAGVGNTTLTDAQVPALGSALLGMPQTLVLNNQSLLGAQPTQLGIPQGPVYTHPAGTSVLAGSGTGVGQLPQALILPNGQIVPVVTQPNLLFPGCAPVSSGFIVTPSANTATTAARPPAPIMTASPSVQVAPQAGQGMLPGGLLMTTTMGGSTMTDPRATLVNSQPQNTMVTHQPGNMLATVPGGPAMMGTNQMGLPTLMPPQWTGPRLSAPIGAKPVNNLVAQPSLALPPLDNPSVQTLTTGDILQPSAIPRVTNPVLVNGNQGAAPIHPQVPRQAAPPLVADVKPSVSVNGTPTANNAAGVTATAILTPEGNIVLTLPPGTQPGNLMFDNNNLPVLGVPPTSTTSQTPPVVPSGGTSQAPNKKNKKGNHRALMPKPNNLPGSPAASGLQPTPALWNTPLFASTSADGTQSDGGNLSDGAPAGSTSPATDPAIPLTISTETSGAITMTTASPTMSSGSQTTDILAKAAESIFSVSDVSPPISSFYNPAHDDNPLHIDTEVAERDDKQTNLAPKLTAEIPKLPAKPDINTTPTAPETKPAVDPVENTVDSQNSDAPPVLVREPSTPVKSNKSRSNRNKSASKSSKKSGNKVKNAVKEEEGAEVEEPTSAPPGGTSIYDFTESPVEEPPVSVVALRHKSSVVDTGAIPNPPVSVAILSSTNDGDGKLPSLSEWERQQHAAATKPKKKSKSKKKDKKDKERSITECDVTTSITSTAYDISPPALAPSMPLSLLSSDLSLSTKSNEDLPAVSLDPPILSLPDTPTTPSSGKKQKGDKHAPVRAEDLLPEKLEFSACDISQVLDQVESLGESLRSGDDTPPTPKHRKNKQKPSSRSGGDQPPSKRKKLSLMEPITTVNEDSTSDILERAMRGISPLDMDLEESAISVEPAPTEQLDSSGKEHERDTDTESEMHIVVSEASGLMSPPLNRSTDLSTTPEMSTPLQLTFSPKPDTDGASVSTSSATVTQPCSLPLTTSAVSGTTSTTSALRPASPLSGVSLPGDLTTPQKLDLSSPMPPLSLPFSTPYKSSLASPLSSFSIPGTLSTPFKPDLASPSSAHSGFSGRLSPYGITSTPRSSVPDQDGMSNTLLTVAGNSVPHTTVTLSHSTVSSTQSFKSVSPGNTADSIPAPTCTSISSASSESTVTSQARHSNIAVLARSLGPPKAVPLAASQARATPQKNQLSTLPPMSPNTLDSLSVSQSERDRSQAIPPPIPSLVSEPARLTHSPTPSSTPGSNTSVLKHTPERPRDPEPSAPRTQDTSALPPSGFNWQTDSGKSALPTTDHKDCPPDPGLDPRRGHLGGKYPVGPHARPPALCSDIPAPRPLPGSGSHHPPASLTAPGHKSTSPANRATSPITATSLHNFGPASQSSYSAESLFSPAESLKSQASSFEDQSPAPVQMSTDPLPRKRHLSSSSQHSSHNTPTTQPDPPQLYTRHQGVPSDMFPPPPGGSSCGMDSRRRGEPSRFPSPYSMPASSSQTNSNHGNSDFLSPSSLPSSTCPSSSSTFSFSLSSTSSTSTSTGRGVPSSAPCRAPMSQSQFPFYPLPGVSAHSHMPSRLPPHGHPIQHQSSMSGQHAMHMLREPNPAHQPRGNSHFPGFGGPGVQFNEPGPVSLSGRSKEHSGSSMGQSMGQRPSPGSSMPSSSHPHPRPSSVSRSPHMASDTPYYPSSSYMDNTGSLGNILPTPPLHHPARPGESARSRSSCDAPGRPASQFSTVSGFSPGGFDPPPLQLTRGAPTPSSQPEMFTSAPPSMSASAKSAGTSRSSENSRSKSIASKSKSQRSSKSSNKKAKHYEAADTNLANSIFESRSMTPLFPLPGMSPPPPGRQLGADGPTYLPSNLFSNPSRPLSNSTPLQHKNPADLQSPFNPLFPTASRGQNGLGLNFQPGFGMNPVAGSQHSASSQMVPHSSAMSVTPHMPNFNLSNLFSDMSGGGQGDGVQISPIKFAHGQTLLPQPGMEHNIPAHHQGAPLYHNRSHPSAMIHNPMSFNSILGHNHHGFDARPMAPPINSGMGPPFGGHGHGSFGMPPLNFPMHEH